MKFDLVQTFNATSCNISIVLVLNEAYHNMLHRLNGFDNNVALAHAHLLLDRMVSMEMRSCRHDPESKAGRFVYVCRGLSPLLTTTKTSVERSLTSGGLIQGDSRLFFLFSITSSSSQHSIIVKPSRCLVVENSECGVKDTKWIFNQSTELTNKSPRRFHY